MKSILVGLALVLCNSLAAQAYCTHQTVVQLECGTGLGSKDFYTFAYRVVAIKVPSSDCGYEGVESERLVESQVPGLSPGLFYDSDDTSTFFATSAHGEDLVLSGQEVFLQRSLSGISHAGFASHPMITKDPSYFTLSTHLGQDSRALLSVFVDGKFLYSKEVSCHSFTGNDPN